MGTKHWQMEEAGLGVKDLATMEYIEDARVCTGGEGVPS